MKDTVDYDLLSQSVENVMVRYEGTFRFSFVGNDGDDDPALRLYDGVHTKDGNELGAL